MDKTWRFTIKEKLSMIQKVYKINLPARHDVPKIHLYTKVYTKSGNLGQREVLIFVPGGPGNDHTACDYGDHSFAESLLPYLDVILFDPRGCGESEKSPIEYCTLEHYIDDIEAIRKYFNISSNQSILLGSSYGAIAALGYAIKYPSTFKKLILVCGAASGECLNDARRTLKKIGTSAQQETGEKILTGNFTFSPDVVTEYYETMGPLYSCSFKPGMPTPSITFNVELVNLGFKEFIKNFDYRPMLSEVKCQTLIIAGENDWIFDKKQSEIIHQGISGSKLIVYPNCGHMIWIDQWEKFLSDVINFIDG